MCFFLCAWPFLGGWWCALHITWFFFLTAFPTRCQCRGALLASHAAWRKYFPTFNLVGDAAPHQNEDGQQLRPTAWLAPAAMLLYTGTRWGTVSSLALQPPLSSLVSFSSTLALCSLLSFTCSTYTVKFVSKPSFFKSFSDYSQHFLLKKRKKKSKKTKEKTKQVKNQK